MLNSEPYEVVSAEFSRMQQRKAVVQSKLRNLISGKVIDRAWQASDTIEEAEVNKMPAMFIYGHREEFWFIEEGNPKNRFFLTREQLAGKESFLKPNTSVTIYFVNAKPVKIDIPVKMDLKVLEAPPAIRGNTAQGGTKSVIVEGGVKINAPLFIETGDVIRINTETGEYVERVGKA